MNSVVYFIQSPEGPVKIGWSADLKRRHASLATPGGLGVVLATIKGGVDLEAHFHETLADYRMNGEWFRPEPPVLELAASIRQGRYTPPAGFNADLPRLTVRISLAKAIAESRDEARILLGVISGPWAEGERVKDVIVRLARTTGISRTRIWDLWYKKSPVIHAAEMDLLRKAAGKAKRESSDPERLMTTMRELLGQLEQVTSALEALESSAKAAERVRRLAAGE